ncbi:hypothetical protein [uncultured Eubacterium sp.]|uniref:hypothetical protein n=1 Tax=uncultured Eubacterium sp. TaxID=165185 RepID=UPI002595D40D|nr:hypothetical protein [uncultured Eubacterium sp.]
MKKRMTKVLALGMMAAMLISAPLSAMAAEAAPADAAATAETQPADAAATAETQPELVMQAAEEEAAATALTNGVDPKAFDGLVQLNDGNWYYMEDGRLSSNASNTVKPACGSWWYVSGWKIDFSFTGFGKNGDDLWYVKDGQVQFGYTGVARGADQYGNTSTYYVTNGRVDKSFRGLAYGIYNGEEGWINFYDGKPKYSYESLVEYNGAWWKMSGYMIDFDYTGAASNESGTWYVRNGQVDFGYTGVIEGKSGSRSYQYYFINGKANENLTGVFYTTVNGAEGWYGFYKGELATSDDYYEVPGRVLSNASGWWYINPKTGLVDFNYNGLGITEDDDWYHYWYVENGQINFNYNGLYKYHIRYVGDVLCYITNGQVDPNVNGVYQLTVNGETNWYGFVQGMQTEGEVLMNPYDGSWWFTGDNGLVDFSYTGIAERYDQNGDEVDSWYVRNGQVDFSSNGWVKINNYYAYVRNGKLQTDVNGLVQATIDGKDGWWEVDHGTLFYNTNHYYTLSYYGGSWWAVYDSQVDFSYTGFVEYDDTSWYVENGRVNFDKTGFVKTEEADTYAYVQNGHYNETLHGVIYGELNGKNSWWQVKDGNCVHSANATWNGGPNGFAANENGLWAIVNGEVAFDVTGEYPYGTYYSVSGESSIYVSYIYQVENGLVTSMQATVLDR